MQPLMHHCTVSECAPAPQHAAWDSFVRDHPRGSLYHLWGWRALIKKTFRHDGVYLTACDETNNIVGVLPLIRQRSRLFGHRLLSMPFFNYGGAIGTSADVEDALMRHAGEVALATGATSIEFRDINAREASWPCRDEKVQMILQLPESPDDLGKQLGSKRRSQIRRARKENPTVQRGGSELLNDFYEVFAITMRDLGTPVYSKRFFASILKYFPDNSELITIQLNGEPVSAALLVHHNGQLEIPWAGTLRKVNRFSINMLLYWEVLEHAIDRKFERFDFGRSTLDSSTFKFKKQWGSEPLPMHWHYWTAPGTDVPKLNPDNPKYQRAIAAWQKLPLWTSKLIGPHLVRNLP